MVRLFSAITIPNEIGRSLSLLRGGVPGARWVDARDYHITLHFFGDVENHIADAIICALDKITAVPFELTLKGVDIFSKKAIPHTIYAAVAPSPELAELHQSITIKMRPIKANLHENLFRQNFFKPHVTIARLKQSRLDDLGSYLTRHGTFASEKFQVQDFVLMSSRKSIGGGPYLIEEKWSFKI